MTHSISHFNKDYLTELNENMKYTISRLAQVVEDVTLYETGLDGTKVQTKHDRILLNGSNVCMLVPGSDGPGRPDSAPPSVHGVVAVGQPNSNSAANAPPPPMHANPNPNNTNMAATTTTSTMP